MTSLPGSQIIDELVEIIQLFTEIALGGAASILLLLVGSALVIFTLGTFGYLTIGAVADLILPSSG